MLQQSSSGVNRLLLYPLGFLIAFSLMKRLLIIAGVMVGVLLLAAVLVPLFINVDSFRPQLEKSLSTALNRQVHVGKLAASVFSGGASAAEISVSDDPAFNKNAFLQASSVKIGLHLMPLIFSRKLEVTSVTVEKPEIVLLKNAAGKWNYSSMGSSAPQAAAPSTAAAPDISVEKFEITDGKIRVGQTGGSGAAKESVYDHVDLVARNISLTAAMPFTLSANTPGGGALKLEGQAGPLNREDSARTPFEAQVKLEHADLATTGFVDPSSGLAGKVDFDGKIKSDGYRLHSEGNAKAENLRVIKGGGPARGPVTLDYRSDIGLETETGTFNADVHTGKSTAAASGTLDAHTANTLAKVKLQGKNMAVDDLVGLLPAFGVVLPSGASLQGGVVNMDLLAEGPLDRLVITGPLNVSGTKLTGYNLSHKLGAIAAFTGIKPSNETLIQTLSSGLRVAPEGIRADNLFLDVPAMGTLSGNGVIGNNKSLDFKMLLKLSSASGNALGGLGGLTTVAQNKGIPFLVTGDTTNPVFRPAMAEQLKDLKSSLLKGDTKNLKEQEKGVKDMLGGFLGKKPTPTPKP